MTTYPAGRVVLFGGESGPNETWSVTPSVTVAPNVGPKARW